MLVGLFPGNSLAGTATRVACFAALYAGFLRAFHWPFLKDLRKK